jgi:hypothetical protein|tara:strand:+ start:1080 stop:1328 length:249 start_codon:yes stop_codon:yes gene_type:complete
MMKVLSRIALCLVLLTGAATAATMERLAKETTVNALVANGWELHWVSSSNNIITYTLFHKRDGRIVTCRAYLGNDNISCFKP